MDDAVRRLVDQAGAGADVLVGGPALAARRLLVDAGTALTGQANLLSVTSAGELSLSSLIAQLAGQTDLGGQDDSVLELGFRRLTGVGRTILMLQVPHGVSRSALRYLQHVSRQAPRLTLVVLGSPSLDALLEEPGFAAIRTRLQAVAPIEVLAPAIVAAAATASIPRRRRLLWSVSALGIAAAVVGIAWLGHSSLRAQEEDGWKAQPIMPAAAATVPAPPLAIASAAPAATPTIVPAVVAAALPTPAEPPHIQAAAAALAPLLEPTPAALVVDRLPSLRRPEPARAARLRQTWPGARNAYQEPAEYADEPGYDEPPPAWVRREFRRREALYPYAVDIYGRPIFRDNR